jgi:hypothetical protein
MSIYYLHTPHAYGIKILNILHGVEVGLDCACLLPVQRATFSVKAGVGDGQQALSRGVVGQVLGCVHQSVGTEVQAVQRADRLHGGMEPCMISLEFSITLLKVTIATSDKTQTVVIGVL